jgi:hypothetical protein
MVVCAIFGVIAAIILPSLAKVVGKKKKMEEERVLAGSPKESIAPRASSALRAAAKGMLPVFSREDIRIALSTQEHRIGMDVYTRFEASYHGQFVMLHSSDKEETVRLDFSFPESTTEARDVSLKLSTGAALAEPQGVVYDEAGIFWSGPLPGNTEVKAEVSFIAQGRDSFVYRLPATSRTRVVQLTLAIQGNPAIVIPDHALQPTSTSSEQIVWQFNNLVSDRAIVIELPGAQSPLGRAMLLCKLVGMAVLLFGAGFWYLSELYKPGLLHAFRWAHFFLLALNYSLFFVVFGVLGFRGNTTTWSAIAIAALLSLPLLMLHVTGVIHAHFAFTRTLPLAIFTLGLVINGVYGGELRDYVFLGAAVISIAFVTVTFRRWATHREEWVKSLENNLVARIKAFADRITTARELDKQAGTALQQSDTGSLGALRTSVEKAWQYLIKQCQEYDSLSFDAAKMVTISNNYQRNYQRNTLGDRMVFLEGCLFDARKNLETALRQLVDARESLKAKGGQSVPGKTHCAVCGHAGEATPFCPHCGAQRPLNLVCGKCGDALRLPLHMMDKNLIKNPIHCLSCGEPYSL